MPSPRTRPAAVLLLASALVAVGLGHESTDGLVLHPACARYRPEPVRTPSRNQRSAPGSTDDPPAADDPLFT